MGAGASRVNERYHPFPDPTLLSEAQATRLPQKQSGVHRRQSDVALNLILFDPHIKHALRDFLVVRSLHILCERITCFLLLKASNEESVFDFFFEVDQFMLTHDEDVKKTRAAAIYETYVKEGCPSDISLDEATRVKLHCCVVVLMTVIAGADPSRSWT